MNKNFAHVALSLTQEKPLVYTAMSKHIFYYRLFISKFVDVVDEPLRKKLTVKITKDYRKPRKRTCHHCKSSYTPSRSDQKFCSDECRSDRKNKMSVELNLKKKLKT